MSVRKLSFVIAAVLPALPLATSARANDCEAKAAEVVAKLGARIDFQTKYSIFLVHGAASGGFAIGCGQRDDADSPSVTMGWNGNPPTDSFWSITASVGGIVTGASPRAIEDGARACYKDAKTKLAGKKNAESDMVRDAISYRCGLMTGDTEPRGTFYVTIVKLKPAD